MLIDNVCLFNFFMVQFVKANFSNNYNQLQLIGICELYYITFSVKMDVLIATIIFHPQANRCAYFAVEEENREGDEC